MEIKATDIVKSIRGRDLEHHYVVIGVERGYLIVADGKSKKINCPKRKNIKHVSFISHSETKLTNDSICKVLKKYKNGD